MMIKQNEYQRARAPPNGQGWTIEWQELGRSDGVVSFSVGSGFSAAGGAAKAGGTNSEVEQSKQLLNLGYVV
jgi:hypothetical protein